MYNKVKLSSYNLAILELGIFYEDMLDIHCGSSLSDESTSSSTMELVQSKSYRSVSK